MLNRKEGFLIMTTQPAWIILYALVSFDQYLPSVPKFIKTGLHNFFVLFRVIVSVGAVDAASLTDFEDE